MAAWLLKTEPSTYSFDDLAREGRTRWDGITNPVALKQLGSAAVGDVVVIYHTGDEKSAIGLGEVVRGAYPDPKNARLTVIDVAAKRRLGRPVTLGQIKAEPVFAQSPLVRQGRLSFVPLTEPQFRRLLELSEA